MLACELALGIGEGVDGDGMKEEVEDEVGMEDEKDRRHAQTPRVHQLRRPKVDRRNTLSYHK